MEPEEELVRIRDLLSDWYRVTQSEPLGHAIVKIKEAIMWLEEDSRVRAKVFRERNDL